MTPRDFLWVNCWCIVLPVVCTYTNDKIKSTGVPFCTKVDCKGESIVCNGYRMVCLISQ